MAQDGPPDEKYPTRREVKAPEPDSFYTDPKNHEPAHNVLVLPRRHAARSFSPVHFLKIQPCLICETLGCVPYLVTPEHLGGQPTGDNLLPLCRMHAALSLPQLFALYPPVRVWLKEHERLDVILVLSTPKRQRRRNRTRQAQQQRADTDKGDKS